MRYLLTILFFFFSICTFAQPDSTESTPQTNSSKDSLSTPVPKEEKHPFVTPKKTALFSAILPGLGQVYNRQYWKVPVIYVGVGVAAYFINDNLKNYNTFRRVYAARVSGTAHADDEYAEYSDDVIRGARDGYRRDLDIVVLVSALGYTLQIIDAVVFAQLKNFDITPDISLRLKPVATPQSGLGLGLVMRF